MALLDGPLNRMCRAIAVYVRKIKVPGFLPMRPVTVADLPSRPGGLPSVATHARPDGHAISLHVLRCVVCLFARTLLGELAV